MNSLRIGLLSAALVAGMASVNAQTVAADSVMQHVKGNRLSVGGYGEVAYSRNFYSDHVSRYSLADEHKNDPSHGRFDIPHAVIYLGYDFGKGWTMGTEIEFEHGGVGNSNSSGFRNHSAVGQTSRLVTSLCLLVLTTLTTNH